MDPSDNDPLLGSEEHLVSPQVDVLDALASVCRQPAKSCLRRWVTVEPCVLLFFLAAIPVQPLVDQYVLQYIHRTNNITHNTASQPLCAHNLTDPAYVKEQEMQAEAANTMMLISIAGMIPSIIITAQVGAYSDRVGRKVALVLPIVGFLLCSIILAVAVQLDLSMWAIGAAFITQGATGGFSMVLAASFAYIADVTTHAQRSIRIFALEIVIGVGIIGSQVALGYLIKTLGFMWPMVITAGIHVVNLLYVMFVVKETVTRDPETRFWTVEHYCKIWSLYWRDDGTGRRWRLVLGLLVMFLNGSVLLGGLEVMTYFQMDSPICFSSVDIGLWGGVRYMVMNVSSIVALYLLHSRLGDTGLMVVGSVTGIGYCIFPVFITSSPVMYISVLSAAGIALVVPLVRSYSSKLVKDDEQGASFSTIANAQSVSVLVGTVVFNSIYSATVKPPYFKGTVFLVQAAAIGLSLLLIVILIVRTRYEKKRTNRSE